MSKDPEAKFEAAQSDKIIIKEKRRFRVWEATQFTKDVIARKDWLSNTIFNSSQSKTTSG